MNRYFEDAIKQCWGGAIFADPPLVVPTKDPRFGDYQCNVALKLAKVMHRKPRELAMELIKTVSSEDLLRMCLPLEVAGPGFINISLRPNWMAEMLESFEVSPLEGKDSGAEDKTVVVDYSSPNVAKELHVGHIRSTIIGDSICRILTFLGYRVIRQNHIGDWGTQFGLLCAYLRREPQLLEAGLSDLEELYRQARALEKEDPGFREEARDTVVALHRGDPDVLAVWEKIIEASRNHYLEMYKKLGVLLTVADERGESFYNPLLPQVVEELKERFGNKRQGPLRVEISDGAVCVFHYKDDGSPMFLGHNDSPLPFIIQKSDGAYLYATTDLAALKFRVVELGADWIIYVTDARQKLHFEMLFATARGAGYAPAGEVKLEHVTFGSILGKDRKPFKTRAGQTVKLSQLLDEAVARARKVIDSNRGFTDEETEQIAQIVGIGAVKYADLSQLRTTDYVFDWDKMLSLEGNTAPYLMYAYARIRSILRKGGYDKPPEGPISLDSEYERKLGLSLLRFPDVVSALPAGWKIHLLADYLYGLAGDFMAFYEHCPVLVAEEVKRISRLRLCGLTSLVLRQGLALLGIEVPERM